MRNKKLYFFSITQDIKKIFINYEKDFGHKKVI